ncbi:MAG: beta-propeller domain-containing protein [Polyangiales bacterium]
MSGFRIVERRSRTLVAAVSALATVAGCYNQSNVPSADVSTATLTASHDCGSAFEAIKADAKAQVDLQVKSIEEGFYYYGWGVFVDGSRGFEGSPVADGATGGTGGATGSPTPTTNEAANDPTGHSDTNNQVEGVDEADIVKVADDGNTLYVIRSNRFYKLDAWPPADLSETANVEIEGYPTAFFVDGDRAVVFSSVWNVPALDGATANGDCYGYAPGEDIALGADVYYCGASYVKVTTLSVSGAELQVDREVYFEGSYLSARRHDTIVRLMLSSSLAQPATVPQFWQYYYDSNVDWNDQSAMIAAAKEWAQIAKAAIDQTELADWMPVHGERIDGEVVALSPSCDDVYFPNPGLTSYGLTQIVRFDMSNANSDVATTAISGYAANQYASEDTLVLAQPDWSWAERGVDHDRTALHAFALNGADTVYKGSTFIDGYINDQFSIDEKDDVLRVATTRTEWEPNADDTAVWVPPTTTNFVTTVAVQADGLATLGTTEPLAEGERIFSARFVGNIGYIVTFRQVDPLFAIDLSDPSNPHKIGELKIPGFSDYMHPLDDTHLLTIGRDIDEQTQQDNGVALQIFDVSNPAEPMLAHKYLLGAGYTDASWEHKAFTYYADKGLLAFPFVNYEGTFSSTLEIFRVSADVGFNRIGDVDHTSLVEDGCSMVPGGVPWESSDAFYNYCGYFPQVRRGVFINDDSSEFVYSISDGGVLVHNLDDLATAIGTAAF